MAALVITAASIEAAFAFAVTKRTDPQVAALLADAAKERETGNIEAVSGCVLAPLDSFDLTAAQVLLMCHQAGNTIIAEIDRGGVTYEGFPLALLPPSRTGRRPPATKRGK